MPAVRAYRYTPSKRHQVQRPSIQALTTRRLAFTTIVLGLSVLSMWVYFHGSTLQKEIMKNLDENMSHLGFRLKDVIVEGRIRTDKAQILETLNLEYGKPLLSLNLSDAKAKLEDISWIKAVQVERRLPHTLFIRISEKEPVFLWQNQGRTFLMDRDGELVETKDPQKYKNLLIVTGEQAPRHAKELMKLLDKFSQLRPRITGATHLRSTRWDIRLDGKIDVKLPEKDAEQALAQLLDLIEQHHLMEQDIMTIDMRLPGQLIVRLTPEAARKKNDVGKDA